MGTYPRLRVHTLGNQRPMRIRDFHLNGSKSAGMCYCGKKRAMPKMLRDSSDCGFGKILGFPGIGLTVLSNSKDDKTQRAAMVNAYPLECPKPKFIISLTQVLKVKATPDKKADKKCVPVSFTQGVSSDRLFCACMRIRLSPRQVRQLMLCFGVFCSLSFQCAPAHSDFV